LAQFSGGHGLRVFRLRLRVGAVREKHKSEFLADESQENAVTASIAATARIDLVD